MLERLQLLLAEMPTVGGTVDVLVSKGSFVTINSSLD